MTKHTPLFPAAILILASSLGASGSGPAGKARFSGTWALDEKASEDPIDRLSREKRFDPESQPPAQAPSRGGGRGQGRGGTRGGGARSGGDADLLADLPTQVLEDDRYLTITDDGESISLSFGPGRERRLITDGEERELDFGDGPAMVTAKRKGGRGEKVLITTAWTTGKKLKESWELKESPRQLLVETEVSARKSIRYRRIYNPTPPRAPTPTPTATALPVPATPTPGPGETPGTEAGRAPQAPAPGGPKPECSIHPPASASQQELSKLAKVSQRDAEARALAAVAPKKASSVISSDADLEDGCLVFSFLLRFPDVKGVQEVVIDAGDGKVISSTWEAQK